MLELSNTVQRVDWNAIRKNYLNTELWDKTYTLYRCGKDVRVEVSLGSIRTSSKILNFDIKLISESVDDGYGYGRYTVENSIPMQIDNFNMDTFENILNGKIEYLIGRLGTHRATQHWDKENLDKWETLKRELNERFDELVEEIEFGAVENYVDINNMRYNFVRTHDYMTSERDDYRFNKHLDFVKRELAVLDDINKAYEDTLPGCDIELDLDFIEEIDEIDY